MTTAPALDPRPHHAAVKAALAPAVHDQVFNDDEVPGSPQHADETLPDLFALVAVERRIVYPRRAGLPGRSSWRLSVRYVGRTVNEALWVLDRTQDALDEFRLTVSAVTSTPLSFESSSPPRWSDGRYAGEVVYTYTC